MCCEVAAQAELAGVARSSLRWAPDLPGGSCGECLKMAPTLPEGDPQAGLDPKSGLLGAGGKPERRLFPAAADAFDGVAHPFQASELGRVYARSQQKPLSWWMGVENLPWGANKGPCKSC